MIVIGITGPTGAGKTTALMELEGLGGCVIDCDAVYHRLLEEDRELLEALRGRFGALELPDGGFDRKGLGRIVFEDPKALEDLNAIAHRHVCQEVDRLLQEAREAGRPAAAIDAIALFESGLSSRCQTTVAIVAPPQVRVERIMSREGISRDYAQARVAAQRPAEYFTQLCDHTLCNDCTCAQDFALRARELFTSILSHQPKEA